ncbi:MAG: hypothetical protein KGL39_09845 [Patescibacteria group bacterium]|nr:hypothetical protein [Patescibacteria group bacterium]
MSTSLFDPQSFLDAQLTEPSEKRPPLPVGDYTAVIGDIEARAWQGKKDPSKSGIAWDIPLAIEIPLDIQSALGLNQPTLSLRDSVMLDLTDNGMIDNAPGKNRRLRMYREATDMNKPGDIFSARKMVGKVVRVKISHDLWEGQPIERVDGVIKA